jgi:hypothetical protein
VLLGDTYLGKSHLAQGKFLKDLTISMWLEDIGSLGLSINQLRQEMDAKLGSGWFDNNVGNRITPELLATNGAKAKAELSQPRPTRLPWWKTLWRKLREYPSNRRVRAHYKKLKNRA